MTADGNIIGADFLAGLRLLFEEPDKNVGGNLTSLELLKATFDQDAEFDTDGVLSMKESLALWQGLQE